MHIRDFIKSVPQLQSTALPGWSAQSKLAPTERLSMSQLTPQMIHKAKKAAVLALCYPDQEGQMHLALIERNSYRGVHSAQISFPGGRPEQGDEGLLETALRETQEEIGCPSCQVMMIRPLSELYIPPSQYYVHPFFGYTLETPLFKKDDREVAQILELPLEAFLRSQITRAEIPIDSLTTLTVPVYEWQGHRIWGATAMMMSELQVLLKQVF